MASISPRLSSLGCQSTKCKTPATQQVLFIEAATPIGTGSVLRGPVLGSTGQRLISYVFLGMGRYMCLFRELAWLEPHWVCGLRVPN